MQRGEHVGICLGNGPRWVALFLAMGWIGAVTVPINTRFKSDELAYALRQSRVRTLFLGARVLKVDVLAMLRGIRAGIDAALPDAALPDLVRVVVMDDAAPSCGTIGWEVFLARGTIAAPATCTPGDTLLIQDTSGTTSFPKGVMLAHRSMCANGFVSGGRMGLRIADRFHSARAFIHVAGTTLSILSCLQHMVTLVTMDRFELGEALRLMEAERCTRFSGNDTMALMLLNHPDRAQQRLVLRGALAAASPAIVRRIIDELGAQECVVGYGLSEVSPNVAQSCWWEPEDICIAARLRSQPVIEICIRDVETGHDCAPGEAGEILVRGWSVMQGYFDKPAETTAALDVQVWLSTGDIGRLGADDRLEFTGRAMEIIRVGGEHVDPAEVDDIVHRHPAIRQAVVVGGPDSRLMEMPCAFVMLNEGAGVTEAELLSWARERMSGFKLPRYLCLVDGFEEICMTASAEVQRKALAAHATQLLGLGCG
jgi:fatty-acyl-CoA synthase